MSKDYNGSVAPKERINISYIPKTDGEPSEVELPLNMLIVGDTGNTQETASLDERQMVSIDKHSFNSVMSEASISLNFAVPAKLEDDAKESDEMNVALEIKSLDDFSPDNVARQVPEVKKLLELREALTALKGPLGNLPAFRAQLQAMLEDEASREQLLREISQAEGK
ncbi:type VI secretion system contractile sheath small subunit [Salmonella enterica subsp. enterica]|uniref:type VI secretion system contractile sheath small subunit n=1 Tax=Salmonella enterica TaxID=28901 RepID=UPI0014104430|nr:type VI secretion system contractile sheath small subunit [Salmonella enterica]EBG5615921.1 type VI secretion system contractile sheath small subunit [Salmonella enterica subsp. enterica serovar Hessarek]ECF2224047.1 type VI secretion system contractile sheath small subunit [Salmonella enterica subsp. enterica serovar Tyresoe]HAU6796769.1 type VI secretion system contractile sheath small subunit [Salmonella enterica subsp. enterica serovar Tyresoe]